MTFPLLIFQDPEAAACAYDGLVLVLGVDVSEVGSNFCSKVLMKVSFTSEGHVR